MYTHLKNNRMYCERGSMTLRHQWLVLCTNCKLEGLYLVMSLQSSLLNINSTHTLYTNTVIITHQNASFTCYRSQAYISATCLFLWKDGVRSWLRYIHPQNASHFCSSISSFFPSGNNSRSEGFHIHLHYSGEHHSRHVPIPRLPWAGLSGHTGVTMHSTHIAVCYANKNY